MCAAPVFRGAPNELVWRLPFRRHDYLSKHIAAHDTRPKAYEEAMAGSKWWESNSHCSSKSTGAAASPTVMPHELRYNQTNAGVRPADDGLQLRYTRIDEIVHGAHVLIHTHHQCKMTTDQVGDDSWIGHQTHQCVFVRLIECVVVFGKN